MFTGGDWSAESGITQTRDWETGRHTGVPIREERVCRVGWSVVSPSWVTWVKQQSLLVVPLWDRYAHGWFLEVYGSAALIPIERFVLDLPFVPSFDLDLVLRFFSNYKGDFVRLLWEYLCIYMTLLGRKIWALFCSKSALLCDTVVDLFTRLAFHLLPIVCHLSAWCCMWHSWHWSDLVLDLAIELISFEFIHHGLVRCESTTMPHERWIALISMISLMLWYVWLLWIFDCSDISDFSDYSNISKTTSTNVPCITVMPTSNNYALYIRFMVWATQQKIEFGGTFQLYKRVKQETVKGRIIVNIFS